VEWRGVASVRCASEVIESKEAVSDGEVKMSYDTHKRMGRSELGLNKP
jgi:hypothetical protein